MKKILSCFLMFSMLLGGCGVDTSIKSPVNFYYLRSDYKQVQTTVIDCETREAYGHSKDLNYLILLYLHGPASETLSSPFPASVTLERLTHLSDTLYITLGGIDLAEQTALASTLSCACLAKTCFDLAPVATIRINTLSGQEAGQQDIVFTADSFVLQDQSTLPIE